MEINKADINSIIPYALNSRDHGSEQVDRIANSIADFGFNQPIVVDENNIIIVGHGRFAAAKKLGLVEVPIVRKADLTDTQKKAYRILDNKLQNDSTWNTESLEIELAALREANFGLQAYGLDELASLIGALADSSSVPEAGTADSQSFEQKYGVIVICAGEAQQKQTFEELQAHGYDCRVVVS